jgi:spore germination cell wall hydrolase CwlJ-like protein
LKSVSQVRANRRAPISAALSGTSLGLALGAFLFAAGLSDVAAERVRAADMAETAAYGYTGSYLEAQAPGLRLALQRYSFRGAADAKEAFAFNRRRQAARHRADLECLTDAVYYEARSESLSGQAAVAQVVLNRVKHPAYPKSVCAVVFQGSGHSGCQFSFTCDGSMRHRREALAWDRARGVAARVLAGALTARVGSATHYHTLAVSPFWAPSMLRVTTVGAHVFYRFSPYRLRAAPTGEPRMEQAVLTSGSADQVPGLRLAPNVESAIEASLESATAPPKVPAAPAPKPAEAAMLSGPQPVSGAAS